MLAFKQCIKGDLQINGISFIPATLSQDKWFLLLLSYKL